MANTPDDIQIVPASRSLLSGLSIIWIIPLIALLVSLGVAWSSYRNQGPLIHIAFEEGTGIAARETELRYRDITVGIVESVGFAENLENVVVSVRLDKEVAPFVDNSSRFWVVQPELTTRGISGLDTVLSGVFIEGSWDNEPGPSVTEFSGLSAAPLYRESEDALQIALRTTENGQFTDNSPILFRGIEVGRIGKARIAPDGAFAVAEAVIEKQYAPLLSSSTRFWDASGFDLTIGPSGASIDFSSIAALVGGGLTFANFVSGGEPVRDGTVFEVFPDKAAARNSVFNASEVEALELSVVFDDNASGLAVGAAVELSGLKVGEVRAVTGIISNDETREQRVRLKAIISIQPARLGLQGEVSAKAALGFLNDRVRSGLRARLTSASLLTGGLKIELVDVEDSQAAEIRETEGLLPIIPSTEGLITDAASTVEGVFTRINNLPIEELLISATDFLDTAQAFVANEELQTAPAEVQALIGDVRALVSSPDLQKVPSLLTVSLERVEAILNQIETQNTVSKLVAAVDAAAKAANGVDTAISGVPNLIDQLNAIAAKAQSLPLDTLIGELSDLATSAASVIGSDDFDALPGQLGAALAEIDATLKSLREGGVIENANATLASTREAADSVANSVQDLPQLMDRMSALLVQASRTLEGYDNGRELSRDAQDAMRDIRQAADAVSGLARKLERDPSLLIRRR